ncbi:MAG: addiction module protein [Planctomycetes bacterium]|nr:addiction module protein [Planctomycetota bacterium]
MNSALEQVLDMKPFEKMVFIETVIKSLDEPNPIIDAIWLDEAKKRLDRYRNGSSELVSFDDIFSDS